MQGLVHDAFTACNQLRQPVKDVRGRVAPAVDGLLDIADKKQLAGNNEQPARKKLAGCFRFLPAKSPASRIKKTLSLVTAL